MDALTAKFKGLLGKRKRSVFCEEHTEMCITCQQTRLVNENCLCYGCFYEQLDGLGKHTFYNRNSFQRVKKEQ